VKTQTNQQPKPYKTIFPTRILSEIIIFVAMAGALSLISHSFFSLPEGGSINIGMIPILWLALRRGPIIGVFAGAVFGFVDLAISPFVVHPIQLILDYPLPFACLGLAGFFRKYNTEGVLIGVTVAGIGRFLCHLTSGAVWFGDYAPVGMNPWLYSAIYNATYLIPAFIVCAIILVVLKKTKLLDIYLESQKEKKKELLL
jgi:thiamine transporter